MKGDAIKLIQFFEGGSKRFIIPLYQRNYDWKEENCKQLFKDLMNLHLSGRSSHFFGSIVSSKDKTSEDRYIIDGQQRITTVSLLMIAMVNAYKKGLIKATNPQIAEMIYQWYLVDIFRQDERKIKLKPIKKDMEAFDALIYKDEDAYLGSSNVTRNYNFFLDQILKSGLTIDEIYNTISRLEVINILLDSDDDPQLIFESLNSTGLDLSEADKIRNYLLMSLSPQDQDKLYTKFWNPIEEYTNYDPSPFVRDYLVMKQGRIGRLDKIYFIFKEYAESLPESFGRAQLLEEMYHYAKLYKKIDEAKIGSHKVNRRLSQMKTLDSKVAYPYYLAFFDYAEATGLSDEQQLRVLSAIETYWARRIICNLPSNVLNKMFATLHREVLNLMDKAGDSAATYADVLAYLLLKRKGSAILPTDEMVKEDFSTRQVYKMPIPTRSFLLERLENRDNDEKHDVVRQLNDKEVTIEHVMPQTLSDDWKKELGPEWERIHQQYLHTMANLTLTGYNSQYSNLPFKTKKVMEKGFLESAYRLNNFIKACDKWTEDEMRSRLSELTEVASRLWPIPNSNFQPALESVDSASLDDEDYEFTGKKLQAFTFQGTKVLAKTWKEMFVNVCMQVLREKKATMEWLSANNRYGFHREKEPGSTELAPNIYVGTGTSTNSKLWTLKNLFKECNIPLSELSFEFRQAEAGETDED